MSVLPRRVRPDTRLAGGRDAEPRDMSHLRARRLQARRRQRLLRVDLGLGVLGAIILLLATPGLAIAAIFALALLLLCVLSIVLERRIAARRLGLSTRSRPRAGGRASDRGADRSTGAGHGGGGA
jgi:hypothetical protein